MKKLFKLPPVILASASPRRQKLLRALGIHFTASPSDASELHTNDLTATEICKLNAYRKGLSVARINPESLVIGADTLVYLGTKLYGKPSSMAEARLMLSELQGRTHEVVTGVCMVHLQKHKKLLFAETTHVKFRQLTRKKISDYLAKINPLDKAGGYAIQEHGDMIVEGIVGSMTNVIGMPMERLQRELEAWSSAK